MKNRFVQVLVLTATVIVSATVCRPAFAQAAPLRGTVLNKVEKPMEDVRVQLRAPDSTEAIEEQVTGEEGLFTIAMENLRPGYELHLHKEGYDDIILPISPQQLVIASIKVTMLRTRGEPKPTPTPSKTATKTPDLSWQKTSADQSAKAIRLYNEAVEEFEEDEPEKKNDAVRKIREAASLDPTFVEPLRFLIRLSIQRQRWAEASRYAEALIRINPKDIEAVRDRYVSLVIMQHFERVGEAAKQLVALEPAYIDHVEKHAKEFFGNENYVMARALYQALTELLPDSPNGYLAVGLCCASLDDVEGTKAAFEAFLERAPEDHPEIESVREDLAALDGRAVPEALESQEPLGPIK